MCRVEEDQSPKESNTQNGNSNPRPPPGEEGPNVNASRHYGNKRLNAKKRKEEFRRKRELKAKEKKEKAALKEKKRKEREEALRRKGDRRTKNQPKILEWIGRREGDKRNSPQGEGRASGMRGPEEEE